jgi:hypothetical protein
MGKICLIRSCSCETTLLPKGLRDIPGQSPAAGKQLALFAIFL